jgi:hypothetical protein
MPYSAPTGWFETVSQTTQTKTARIVFHMNENCPAIKTDGLKTATRPNGAKRCPQCAAP